jgi:NAD(P)H dehydrogenase (quinone)
MLVIGATGSLGRDVLIGLVGRGIAPATVTAIGRNTSRLAELTEARFGSRSRSFR